MFEKTLETGSIQNIHKKMVTASFPFAILILSSYLGVSERIVSELQSVFALQSTFTEIEMRMGELYKKSPFQYGFVVLHLLSPSSTVLIPQLSISDDPCLAVCYITQQILVWVGIMGPISFLNSCLMSVRSL